MTLLCTLAYAGKDFLNGQHGLQLHAHQHIMSHSGKQMADAALPHAEVNIVMSPSMDFTDSRDCQTLHSSVVVDMTEDAAQFCCG